jgi:hypothetical protein
MTNQRDLFERWLKMSRPGIYIERDADCADGYFEEAVQIAWEAWQEASKPK